MDPGQLPVNPYYFQALENQLATARFMRHYRPFNKVREHLGRPMNSSWGGMDALVADALEHAAPHFWTGPMTGLLDQSADALPDWTLRPQDIAVPSGYVWFDRPIPLLPGDSECLRAFLWTPVAGPPSGNAPHKGGIYRHPGDPAIALMNGRMTDPWGPRYLLLPFTVYDGLSPVVMRSALINQPPAHGLPRRALAWAPGETLSQWLAAVDEMFSDPAWSKEMTDASGLGLEQDRAQTERWGRLFATALALMNQTLVEVAPFRGDRAARRRVEALQGKQPDEPVVRAVMLRRREYVNHRGAGPDDPEPRDWSCRWTVRAHWRQQWYPSLGVNKPLLINPYVKGPEGKPLKVSQPIFVVAR
jgi:hypothetical protein